MNGGNNVSNGRNSMKLGENNCNKNKNDNDNTNIKGKNHNNNVDVIKSIKGH
jgi:hypothetical protein